MLLKEVVIQAASAVRDHRFRAGLTMLGIAWGIVTVVLLLAYGQGFHRALTVGFRNAFSDGVGVLRGGQTSLQAGGERAGRRIRLKVDDVPLVAEQGFVKYVSPEYLDSLTVSWGTRQTTVGVRGVAPEYGVMRSETPDAGRFLNHEDVERRRRVAFLGAEVVRRLFSNIQPVGETVRIAGVSFEVIGVLSNKAQLSSYYYPDKMSVFVPHTTMRQLWPREFVNDLVFQALDPSLGLEAEAQVRAALAARYRFDPRDDRAVTIFGSRQIMQIAGGMSTGLQVVLIFIGTLTLMIGGVGVMNIMLVSVQERTREIGVRKALGARRRHILLQFLLEGLAITAAGGLIGILLSFALVAVAGSQPFLAELIDDPSKQTDIHLLLSPGLLLTATGILGVTGLLSGFVPAFRASRLDPIESLRYE